MWFAVVSKLDMLTGAQVCVHLNYDQSVKSQMCDFQLGISGGLPQQLHNILSIFAKHPEPVCAV